MPSGSQALGTEVHAQIENFIAYGKPLDLTRESGQIALSGAHHWPRPGEWRKVETHFANPPFHGFLDLIDYPGMPRVTDHKTTKDFGYAKTPLDLLLDPQACIYADAALKQTGAPRVQIRWLYYRTKKPYKSLPVVTEVDRHDIAPTMIRVAGVVKEIHALLSIPRLRALDLPPNPASCDAFGGCEHRERCNLTDSERIFSFMNNGNFIQGAQDHGSMLAALNASAQQQQQQNGQGQPQGFDPNAQGQNWQGQPQPGPGFQGGPPPGQFQGQPQPGQFQGFQGQPQGGPPPGFQGNPVNPPQGFQGQPQPGQFQGQPQGLPQGYMGQQTAPPGQAPNPGTDGGKATKKKEASDRFVKAWNDAGKALAEMLSKE